jgi:hypothetical protein
MDLEQLEGSILVLVGHVLLLLKDIFSSAHLTSANAIVHPTHQA